jgi:EAL domain-containing protein (putative c-di-GMP-specific phosphodiesterase class I)
MDDTESNASLLHELKKMGVRIAVDDFCTGYSSVSFLRQFPIDVIKIDQSFIPQMTNDSEDFAHVDDGADDLFSQPVAAAQFAHLLQIGLADAVVH